MAKFNYLIKQLIDGERLDAQQIREAMSDIVAGTADPIAVGAWLVALHIRGESPPTLRAAAEVLLEVCVPFEPCGDRLVDTCGTGGDGVSSFNVSSAAALVVAAAGVPVAKHGNRSVSSSCGSADLFEAAGVAIDLDASAVAQTIRQVGIGFLFAPCFHPALAKVAPIRQSLGVRTIFNLLGPLVNPARPPYRIIGVFDQSWLEPMAEAVVALGAQHALVVHSDDGMDEISVSAPTQICEIDADNTACKCFRVEPEQFGIEQTDLDSLRVDGVDQSLALLRSVLSGEPSAAYDATVLNAGAALYVAGLAPDIAQGVSMARDTVNDKRALDKLDEWVQVSSALQEK